MSVRVQEADFDLNFELTALRAGDARIGALASFVGLVRDINDGAGVSEMTLEHYPGMTEKALEAIVEEAKEARADFCKSSNASPRAPPAFNAALVA